MKRYKLNCRPKFYNEHDCFSLIPVLRHTVVPGQTLDISGRVKMQTAAFTQNLLTSGLASLYLYYVPNRLLWDDWIDFVSQETTYGGTFPTTINSWPIMFDRTVGSKNFSSLYRRAYKLCYNEFFGDQPLNGGHRTFYPDVFDDTDDFVCQTKTTEQFAGRLEVEGAVAVPTFDATTVPIDLNDFYRQMMNARSRRKANMSGDKYVDAMRRMGVELDWRVQNAPEFLGKVDKSVHPIKTFDTTAAEGGGNNVGDSFARYETTLEINVGGKRFAEHGQILGLMQIRPHMFNELMGMPPDGLVQEIEDFYLADNVRAQDTWQQTDFTSGASSEMFAQKFSYLRNGTHMFGHAKSWLNEYAPAHIGPLSYPDGDVLPVGTELGTSQVAVAAEWRLGGQIPVPPNAL